MLFRALTILCFMLFIASIPGCSADKSIGASTKRYTTNNAIELPEVKVVVQHLNDSVSRLFIRINNEQLLYKRRDTGFAFFASVNVHAIITAESKDKTPVDSINITLNDRSESEVVNSRNLETWFDCKTANGIYLADLEFFDMNRHVRYFKQVRIDHKTFSGAQNFAIYQRDSLLFDRFVNVNKSVVVSCFTAPSKSLEVEYYVIDANAAAPPFSVKDAQKRLQPDSVSKLVLVDGKTVFMMPAKGFCKIKMSSETGEGLVLFGAEEIFPRVSSSLEMVQCTRYIMSKEEFDKCLNADDKKAAIDEFWLGIGSSQERARELLRKYYLRVQDANKSYSSYMPGWKTDRGMISIVFGQPYSVYRDKQSEVWIYGNDANPNSLRFVFKRSDNAVMESDLILERSVFYRDIYHNAVDFWRQGVVFNDLRR